MVPKIMFQPKWYDSSKDLEEGDLVYFQKKEGKLDTPWTIGMVEQVVRSERDQTIRKIVVKYRNPGENFPRLTDRSIRTLVKLFNVDEFQVQDDLTELQKKIDKIRNNDVDDVVQEETVQNDENNEDVVHTSEDSEVDEQDGDESFSHSPATNMFDLQDSQDDEYQDDADQGGELHGDHPQHGEEQGGPAANTRSRRQCLCCCEPHCNLTFHTLAHSAFPVEEKFLVPCELDPMQLDPLCSTPCVEPELENQEDSDTLARVLMSLNIQM